jgi:hypothetical protein
MLEICVGPYSRICIRRLNYVLARVVDWKMGGADGGLWGHEKRKVNILDDLLIQRGKANSIYSLIRRRK